MVNSSHAANALDYWITLQAVPPRPILIKHLNLSTVINNQPFYRCKISNNVLIVCVITFMHRISNGRFNGGS